MYISYAGYDVTLPYVTTSLSDSVSWQAQLGSAAQQWADENCENCWNISLGVSTTSERKSAYAMV